MKKIILILILVMAASAIAADKDNRKPAEPTKEKSAKKQVEEKTPEWPRPYKATEQISADSVVPFPVDI